MPVKKTESRIPAGFTASDLGDHAASSTSPAVLLIAHLSSPVAARRLQRFTVFITDAAIAATADNYSWTISNNTVHNEITSEGYLEYTPQSIGAMNVTVTVRDSGNNSLFVISLNQTIIALNSALELQIDQDENNFPGAGHPETSREIINDIRPYINNILPVATSEIFNKSISAMAYTTALAVPQVRRHFLTQELATLLHSNIASFYGAAKDGFGICKTRPQLLAMCLQNPAASPNTTYLDIASLEQAAGANSAARTANATTIETAFNALGEEIKMDIFNLLRFPKSHVAMCKLIIEKLHDRYYNTATLSTTMAAVADARKIFTEYEKGPIALGTGSTALSPSAGSRRLFTLTNHAVWAIPVTPLSASIANPSGGLNPTIPAIPATVGSPEKLPSLTYIAHYNTEAGFGAGSLGFLRKAVLYHQGFNLNPQLITSMEALIDTVSASTASIDRLRIVTHFGTTTGITDLTGNGLMFLPFFTGQTRNDGTATISNHTRSQHLQYGISDDAGIVGQFELDYFPSFAADFLSSSTMTKQGETTARSYHDSIFRHLQSTNHASLTPFGLQTSGTPSTAVRNIMKWAANLFCINNLDIKIQAAHPSNIALRAIPLVLKNRFTAFVNEKLASLSTPTGPTTLTNIMALAAAFSSQTLVSLQASTFSTGMNYTLSSVYMANHDAFRIKLQSVKNRLNHSFVDVRGCRVGQDRTFLESLRTFFGNAGQEPTVSGPEWFQNMGTIGNATITTEGGMDSYFSSGVPGTSISAIDVQREYSAWAGRVGINSQISFWISLFNGSEFDLVSLAWRVNLPPIGMHSKKLIDLQSTGYAATIALVKDIFKIPTTTAPLAAACQTFETSFFASAASIKLVEVAMVSLTDASPQPDLLAQRTALQTQATVLSATLPAAPATITKAHLQACITTLKTAFTTHAAITPLATAIKAKLQDPKAGYRYMLSIGLPLLLQAATNEGDNRILYYPDQVVNALNAFQRIHFEGPLPPALLSLIDGRTPVDGPTIIQNNVTDVNDDDYTDLGFGLAYSGLSFDRTSTQAAVNPSPEYKEHIITEPV